MSYTDELLQDTPLTEQMMLQDVETMGLYCEDMQIPCKVVPATAQAPLPTLVAMLDSGEADRPWVLTHSFMPLDRETAEFTKYLQFYCELPGSLDGVLYYITPDFSNFSGTTILAAVGQLFYSMSLAMGIMIMQQDSAI